MKKSKTIILGAGVTGLAVGFVTGAPIYEKKNIPGGICASYYMKPGTKRKFPGCLKDKLFYRFETGGGHWIFGTDKEVEKFLAKFCTPKRYQRRSAVYFSKKKLYVPYPIQNNLRYLSEVIKEKTLKEISDLRSTKPNTLKKWLQLNFGKTLCNTFFFPFHERYTAGLFKKIAPQDSFKTPINISQVAPGAKTAVEQVGYNAEFVYPEEGLNVLMENISGKCDVRYQKEVQRIDVKNKIIYFKDKTSVSYDKLISTLPLSKIIKMANLRLKEKADPYTSVLVVNIAAVKGSSCPSEHWLYIPDSKSGFYRVGFYSNVDESFLPKSLRKEKNRVSIYVERAYANGNKPSAGEINAYISSVIRELQGWDFIGKVEVMDSTWIDVAYTWSYPGSKWRSKALGLLEKYDIYQIGRYGRWHFQGIAESIKEGLACKAFDMLDF